MKIKQILSKKIIELKIKIKKGWEHSKEDANAGLSELKTSFEKDGQKALREDFLKKQGKN